MVRGVIYTDRGDYTLLTKRFQIRRGSATFVDGPDLNPTLQITGEYQVNVATRGTVNIQVQVGGTLKNPNVSLESDAQPPRSQSDLLTLIAFGQSTSSLIATSGSSVVATGASDVVGSGTQFVTWRLATIATGVLARASGVSGGALAQRGRVQNHAGRHAHRGRSRRLVWVPHANKDRSGQVHHPADVRGASGAGAKHRRLDRTSHAGRMADHGDVRAAGGLARAAVEFAAHSRDSVDRRIRDSGLAVLSGPVDRWTGGPVDRWTGGPVEPVDRWTGGPVDRWTGGPVDRWTGGPVDRWTGGPVDRWTGGPVDRWTGGPVDRWTGGPVDRWTGGPVATALRGCDKTVRLERIWWWNFCVTAQPFRHAKSCGSSSYCGGARVGDRHLLGDGAIPQRRAIWVDVANAAGGGLDRVQRRQGLPPRSQPCVVVFLFNALGSAAELQFQIELALELSFGDRGGLESLRGRATDCKKMLSRLIASLRRRDE